MHMSLIPPQRNSLGPSRRSAAAAALFVVLALLFGLAPAAAAETSLEVTTPAGDFGLRQFGTVVLLVTVTGEGAVEGDLVVSTDGVAVAVQRVEVPGGSSKTVALTVPVAPWSGYDVLFNADDDEDASATRFELRSTAGDELVAVFPALAGRGMPETADLTIDVGRARLFAFDPALLDLGRDVLAVFGYAIVAPEDLDRLSEPAREALWSWVALSGGSLVVTADPSDVALPAGLDAEFVVDDPRRALLGAGSVLFAGGDLDDGYDGLLAPVPVGLGEDLYWVDSWSRIEPLAIDAGVSVAPIGLLVIALIVYAVLAGPVLWLWLRRSRREPLLWLALPVLAILVTGVLYGAGRRIRESAGTAHASLVVDVLGERYRATYVLVNSPNGGSAGVTLAPGWSHLPLSGPGVEFEFGSGFDNLVSSTGRSGGTDDRLLIELDPGQFGIVTAQASAPSTTPAFAVTTRREDPWLHVEIANRSVYTLQEVVIGTLDQALRVNQSLAPGDSHSVRLPLPTGISFFGGDPLFEEIMWGGGFFNGRFIDDDFGEGGESGEGEAARAASPAIVADFLAANTHLRREGFITVVGWTREPEAPLQTHAGRSVQTGSTALATVTRIDPSGSVGSNLVTLLRNWETTSVIDQAPGSCSEGPVTLRVERVGGFAPGEVAVLDTSRGLVGLDVWDGESWVPAGIAELQPNAVIELPEGAVAADAAHVRLAPGCDAFGNQDTAPELRPLAGGEAAVRLGGADYGDSAEEA